VLVATQLRSKHISAAVNQHATIEEAVFSVGRSEKLTQLELETNLFPELAFGRIMARKKLGCAKKTSWCAAVTVRLL
jgi:hypothetical protein